MSDAMEMMGLEGWAVEEVDGVRRLRKRFRFDSEELVTAFRDRLKAVSDLRDHHPKVSGESGELLIEWWTHSARGLTERDFQLARQTDLIAADPTSDVEEYDLEGEDRYSDMDARQDTVV